MGFAYHNRGWTIFVVAVTIYLIRKRKTGYQTDARLNSEHLTISLRRGHSPVASRKRPKAVTAVLLSIHVMKKLCIHSYATTNMKSKKPQVWGAWLEVVGLGCIALRRILASKDVWLPGSTITRMAGANPRRGQSGGPFVIEGYRKYGKCQRP